MFLLELMNTDAFFIEELFYKRFVVVLVELRLAVYYATDYQWDRQVHRSQSIFFVFFQRYAFVAVFFSTTT